MRSAKFLICLIIIFSPFKIFSAPCYGTKIPKQHKIFIGLQTYNIVDRDLENNMGSVRSLENFLLLSYGVFDWFSLDLKIGAGDIRQNPLDSDEIDYPRSFSGGYGLRIRLYNKNNFKSVFGFQHISVHPKKVIVGNSVNRAILDGWQVSFLASYDFKFITPYIGGRWSRVDYIHKVNNERKRIMSDPDRSFGFVFGFDIPIDERFWLNLESQFFDSQAYSFSINYSF
ncbi:MAG: hypothetical protein NC935_06605 [Candidatus Omnitrophica bacterium]|nr:hypothetical protein [Candidatus Omnitrophota bacterium]